MSEDDLRKTYGPFFKGEQHANTAEELMRSRYAAFALGEIDYILATHDPETREEVERDAVTEWSTRSEWLGFDILNKVDGEQDDASGTVDFVARYRIGGLTTEHRERAEFRKHEGKWVFVDGTDIPKEKKPLELKWKPKGKRGKKKRK